MMPSRFRRFVVLLGVLLLGVSGAESAHAQDVARDSIAGDPDAVLRSLEARQRLRVELTGGTRRAGRFVGFAEDRISIGRTDGAREVSYVPVDRVEVLWTEGNSAG